MDPSAPAFTCARCGQALLPGCSAYLVSIAIVADFDGALPDEFTPAEQTRLWEEIASRSREELENEVCERQSYRLCRSCRDRWSRDPLGRGEANAEPGRVH